MGDPVLIGIRFALYADLMLIAGLAAFPLFALTRSERLAPQSMMASIWRAERWLCAAGLLLCHVLVELAGIRQNIGNVIIPDGWPLRPEYARDHVIRRNSVLGKRFGKGPNQPTQPHLRRLYVRSACAVFIGADA